MQIVRKDIDSLNVTLDFIIEPSDYAAKFESELKKYKNQAQMKGFRKGMTPISVIKKMYGKNILSDVINETLSSKLYGYLDENKIKYLGQPIPNRDENLVFNLDVNNLKDYPFSFDLGLSPTFDLKGVSPTDEYEFYDVEINDDLVTKEIEASRKRFGKRETVEDTIQNMDMIKIDASEMDGNDLKDNGWNTEFTILVDVIHDESIKSELQTKKLGDTFIFDITKMEDKDQNYVNRYLLNKPADSDQEIGHIFEGKIIEVTRVIPAELDETFFSTFGDDSIVDEPSLRESLRNQIKDYYDRQSTQFMNRDIMDHLMEVNDIPLPTEFLKRYLKETNDTVSDEVLENEFEPFTKNMQWSLQKSHLATQFGINVNEEDIKRHFTNSVFSYMRQYGNMDYEFVTKTVDRLMQDQEQVNKAYEEILADSVFAKINEIITKKKVAISMDDFVEKVKALNEKVNNL